MAPLPEIADTYRVALIWNQYNAVNVLHVHAASSTPSIVGDGIAASVSAGMWHGLSTAAQINSLHITPLFDDGATFVYPTDGSAKWKGGQAGDVIPAAAIVVSEKTVFRGPANRGRVFLGPVAESVAFNGILSSAEIPTMTNAWTAFGAALITHSMQHVVASYKNATAITVVNYSIRQAFGTMRPRQSRLAI